MNDADKWGSLLSVTPAGKWLTGNKLQPPARGGACTGARGAGRGGGEEGYLRGAAEGGHQWLRPAGSPAAGRAPVEGRVQRSEATSRG